MDILQKASILSDSGRYDSCGPQACEVKIAGGLGGIYHAKAENQNCRLFKTLMENKCSFDCKYCGNSSHCKRKKASYSSGEMAKLFDYMVKKDLVDGLFISSAIPKNPDLVVEKMISEVKLIRYKYNFQGYIHFKILPGTSKELIKEAASLSSRLSINIEAPNKSILSELSSCKDYKIDILRRQAWISRFRLGGGQTTQMIVNNISTDLDILKMTEWEYKAFDLKRVYFSAFNPIKGTPLEGEKAVSGLREHRLYNSDFLLRKYSFKLKEIKEVLIDGMLPLEDPKLALAKQNFDRPLDLNEASYEEILRVPGIGPRTVPKIMTLRRKENIKKFEQLKKIGVILKRARPFIKVDGKWQKRLGCY